MSVRFCLLYDHLNASLSPSKFVYYPPTKSEGYSFGVVRPSVRPSGTISQYLLFRFDSFLVQLISTLDSRYPISLVKSYCPCFSIGNYNAKPILAFFV